MDANSKKPTTEELFACAWKRIEDSHDFLEEFYRQQDALEEWRNEWEHEHPVWESPTLR